MKSTIQFSQTVSLLLHIPEVQGSKQRWDTAVLNDFRIVFSQSPTGQ